MWRLLKGGLTEKGRLVHTFVATALAVSLLAGTFILADTIRSSFQRASGPSPGSIDLVVRSTAEFTVDGAARSDREPVPASLLDVVRSVPGVGSAWGMVWGYAQVVDERGSAIAARGMSTVGTAWTPADTLVSGRVPARAGEVAIDAGTAQDRGLDLGHRVRVVFAGAATDFTISGLSAPNQLAAGSTVVSFDLGTAQGLLGRDGRLDAAAVRAAPGVAREALRARIGASLAARLEVVTFDQTAKEAKESWTHALDFLQTVLVVFAVAALLVGGFVIANTFSIVVAQRSRELGLLRAIGASRTQLLGAVLAEATVMGVCASALGVVAGLGTARGLLGLLGGAGFELPTTSVVFRARTGIAALACGVGVTAAAALLPAWRATRVSPTTAAGGTGAEPAGSRIRRLVLGGVAAMAGGGVVSATLYTPARPGLATIGLGAVLLLVGLGILLPVVAGPAARLVGHPLVRIFGQSAFLGRENAVRNPRRTGATAGALTIGIGLVGVIAIVGASAKASATRAVRETLRADFVVRNESAGALSAGVPPIVADRLRGTSGVGLVSEIRAGQWGLTGVTQSLLAVDPSTVAGVHELDGRSRAAAASLGDGTVLVRDSVAERNGWKVGDQVPMTFARTGTRLLRVGGTFSASVRTDYVVSLATYEANYTRQLDEQIRIRLAPGTSAAAGRSSIKAVLADIPGVAVMNRSEVVAAQERQVDRLLMPVTAILALSILIALVGLANTLALSIRERTREIGLLRSVGMAPRQLRSMVRVEAVIMAALGALSGVAVAVLLGWSLVSSMGDLGVTDLVLPVPQLLAWVAIATTAGVMAAILPARRAATIGVLEAVSGR